MLYGKPVVHFFSTYELLYTNLKKRLGLIRVRHKFYIITVSPNVNLGIVDCSLYTRCIALEKDNHEKIMDTVAHFLVDFNHIETLTKTFIISARQNQFVQENICYNAPVHRSALAMITNSASTASYTENLLWYQQFDVR